MGHLQIRKINNTTFMRMRVLHPSNVHVSKQHSNLKKGDSKKWAIADLFNPEPD